MDYKYLKNFRNLKAFFKGASSTEIESIQEKLTSLHDTVKSQEEHEQNLQRQKAEFLNGLLNELDNHNFTVDDLAALKGMTVKENRPKMKAKCAYVGTDGVEYTWSGQGKIPSMLQEVMKRDGIVDKKHYLIKTEED